MTRITDEILTEQGASMPSATGGDDRVLLIACGALAREILAVRDLNRWDHIDLTCLPAKLHNRPERIPEAVREKIREGRQTGYRSIFVVYADCGTGGLLDRVCAEEEVERIAGPHCYSFFDGNEVFAERGEVTSFYLTDFLARQFETLIWKGLGLDRHPELRDAYFGNYDSLVYLAQSDNPELVDKARRAAERLGLDFRMRRTGYGDLVGFLERVAE